MTNGYEAIMRCLRMEGACRYPTMILGPMMHQTCGSLIRTEPGFFFWVDAPAFSEKDGEGRSIIGDVIVRSAKRTAI
jgi:hypothetical protein